MDVFLKNTLKVNVNFRIHRLHLMKYRQQTNESLDAIVIRARTLALKCDFNEDEISERIVGLIIASTPHEEFRRDLIGKEKGYAIAQILKEGRKFEAMMADRDRLQQMEKGLEDIHFIRKEIKCQNCGRNHKPRKCPAYNDECRLCALGKMLSKSSSTYKEKSI